MSYSIILERKLNLKNKPKRKRRKARRIKRRSIRKTRKNVNDLVVVVHLKRKNQLKRGIIANMRKARVIQKGMTIETVIDSIIIESMMMIEEGVGQEKIVDILPIGDTIVEIDTIIIIVDIGIINVIIDLQKEEIMIERGQCPKNPLTLHHCCPNDIVMCNN